MAMIMQCFESPLVVNSNDPSSGLSRFADAKRGPEMATLEESQFPDVIYLAFTLGCDESQITRWRRRLHSFIQFFSAAQINLLL